MVGIVDRTDGQEGLVADAGHDKTASATTGGEYTVVSLSRRSQSPAVESQSGSNASLKRSRSQEELDRDRDGSGDARRDQGMRGSEDGWRKVERGRPAKKAKKLPSKDSSRYPALDFSDKCKLQTKISVSNVRDLVLYIFADGTSPHWIAVKHRPEFRKIVCVFTPGLEEAMFKENVDLVQYDAAKNSPPAQATDRVATSPDDYYPRVLSRDAVPPSLKPFADMFPHLWPVRAPGDDRYPKLHSPMTDFLTARLGKQGREDGNNNRQSQVEARHETKSVRTRITEFIASPSEYLENGFSAHPASLPDEESRRKFQDQDGWVHTRVERLEDGDVPEADIQQGSITAGREVLALDCEMCLTGENNYSLTRISIISWDGEVLMDELVKPDKPITDYLTRFSGIYKELLDPVMTTLKDIQVRLLDVIGPRTILVGHSLDSDLKALQLTHPFIVDTSILFPHPRGPPLKSSLKYLAQKHLGKEIQKGGGPAAGHNSIEDARACLELVKKKCEKGKDWAAGESQGENLFKRLARTGTGYRSNAGPEATGGMPLGKSSAAIDWGDVSRTMCVHATFPISCQSDAEVEAAVLRAVKGDPAGEEIPAGGVDFVWARMRELEYHQGWNRSSKGISDDAAATESGAELAASESLESRLTQLSDRLARIHASLPPCTAFMVLSGSGDPREMSRLQGLQAQWKREYNTPGKKWDQLSVQWTDVEDQALRQATLWARQGIGFLTVK